MSLIIFPISGLVLLIISILVLNSKSYDKEFKRKFAGIMLILIVVLGIGGSILMYKDIQYQKERTERFIKLMEKRIEFLEEYQENLKQMNKEIEKIQNIYDKKIQNIYDNMDKLKTKLPQKIRNK